MVDLLNELFEIRILVLRRIRQLADMKPGVIEKVVPSGALTQRITHNCFTSIFLIISRNSLSYSLKLSFGISILTFT